MAALAALLASGPAPSPKQISEILTTHPGERDVILARLHATFGNAYVQAVFAAGSVDSPAPVPPPPRPPEAAPAPDVTMGTADGTQAATAPAPATAVPTATTPARPAPTATAEGGGAELPHRAQMEASFGQDFSNVKVKTGQAGALGQINAAAAARGEEIAFGEASPSPKLVAHELAHVVQHRQTGGTDLQRKPTIASTENAAEREADVVADRVAAVNQGSAGSGSTARPTPPRRRRRFFGIGAHD